MENLNRALTCAVLAEGTNANTFKTTYACSYAIKGLSYYKAATDNIAFTAGTPIGLLSEAIIAVDIDKDGTVSTVQGASVLTADLASGVKQLVWPPLSRDKARLGGIRVKCASSANFTPGSTDLSASNVTGTYYNLADYPSQGEGVV